jgi:PKD repeat protein
MSHFRLAVAAAAVFAVLALAGAAGAQQPLTASFEFTPAAPVPGEQIDLHATSTSSSTAPIRHSWDLDGDGQFDDATGDAVRTSFAIAGSYVVRLKAIQPTAVGTSESVAERTIVVGTGPSDPPPPPPPAQGPAPGPGNEAPVAVFDKKCTKVGTLFLCAGLAVREGKPAVLDASPSHDPDGQIVRYEWDLDGNGSFETDAGAAPTVTHTFELYKGLVDPRKRPIGVRVTDDKGATATTEVTLTLLEPSCQAEAIAGHLRATSMCLRARQIEVDGVAATRYYASVPVVINGITVVPAENRTVTITVPTTGHVRIGSNGAAVTVPAKASVAALHNGVVSWEVVSDRLEGFELDADATLNGLRITGMPSMPQLSTDGRSSTMLAYVALPQKFGGSTSDQPVRFSPGKATASASGALAFEVRDATIGPIGLKQLKVSFDGVDLWEIAASVALPEPVPYLVSGDAGIRNGEFEHAGASVNFGTPGIGPIGPIFIQRIAFRVEVAPKKSKCVPKVGIEKIDLWEIYRSFGVEPAPDWPRYGYIDHGIPTFALCGEVGLTGGPTILGAAAIRADAGLGLATYDDRPAVFRAFGKLSLVEIPLAEATFELHTDGYVKARADFGFGIPDVASVNGFLLFEMLGTKFNAEAYVRACVDLVDLCAGARGLVSSKGLAVCLHVDVLGATWEPGFGYEWGDVFPTLYFSGCDVGDYREHISHARARAAGVTGERSIDLPAGLPGAVIVAEGRDAPPKITLVGPNGERVTTPDGMKAVQSKPFLLIKNQKGKNTQIAIGQPAAGRWRVIVEDGSSELVSLKSAQGLEAPEVHAQVVGTGHKRAIRYRVAQREGQKVTFVERGASAGTIIGEAKGSEGEVAFHPADGKAERREIVALVEQDGQLRDEIKVAGYQAPGPVHPARIGGLQVRHRGSAVRASWRRAANARAYEVSLRLSDGRRVVRRTRARALVVGHVGRRVRGTVQVRGISAAGMKGSGAARKVRAAR